MPRAVPKRTTSSERPGPLFAEEEREGNNGKEVGEAGWKSLEKILVCRPDGPADMRFRGLGTRAVVCRACFSE